MNTDPLLKRLEKRLSEELGIPEGELELEMTFLLTAPFGTKLCLPSPIQEELHDPEYVGRFVVGIGPTPTAAMEDLIKDYREEQRRLAKNHDGCLMGQLHGSTLH